MITINRDIVLSEYRYDVEVRSSAPDKATAIALAKALREAGADAAESIQ